MHVPFTAAGTAEKTTKKKGLRRCPKASLGEARRRQHVCSTCSPKRTTEQQLLQQLLLLHARMYFVWKRRRAVALSVDFKRQVGRSDHHLRRPRHRDTQGDTS